VLISGLRAGSRPQVTDGALGEAFLVHADLPADEIEAPVQVADLRGHAIPVLAQEIQPFLLVAGSLPDERGIEEDSGSCGPSTGRAASTSTR